MARGNVTGKPNRQNTGLGTRLTAKKGQVGSQPLNYCGNCQTYYQMNCDCNKSQRGTRRGRR